LMQTSVPPSDGNTSFVPSKLYALRLDYMGPGGAATPAVFSIDDILIYQAYGIKGHVYAGPGTGTPLAGASVTIGGVTRTTNATGAYWIPEPTPGTGVAITASMTGYVDSTVNIDIANPMLDHMFVDFNLSEPPKIAGYKTQPNGTVVSLKGMPVTVSPTSGGVNGSGTFYIEEYDRSVGIRIQNDTGTQETPIAGKTVTIDGEMATLPSGERYVSASNLVTGADASVKTLGTTTKAVQEDTKLGALYVKAYGKIQEIGTGYFTIADGYNKNGGPVATKILELGDPIDPSIVVGDFIMLTGAVSPQTSTGPQDIILESYGKSIPPVAPHEWTCGFEPSEGFTPGNINGQVGWSVVVDPDPTAFLTTQNGGTATVVGAPNPVEGTQALKLTAIHTDPLDALQDKVFIKHNVSTANLQWVIVEFDIWRQQPIGNNDLFWYSADLLNPEVWSGAQWDSGSVTTPMWNGSVPTIQNRYARVSVLTDFANQKYWTWYDGQMIDNGAAWNSNGVLTFRDLELFYWSTVPFLAGDTGVPAYVDNVRVGWKTTSDP
jgi:hypothetical protein